MLLPRSLLRLDVFQLILSTALSHTPQKTLPHAFIRRLYFPYENRYLHCPDPASLSVRRPLRLLPQQTPPRPKN